MVAYDDRRSRALTSRATSPSAASWSTTRLTRDRSGLLCGKRAAVIYTSAVYGPGRGPAFGADFQATYFTDWLRWAGVTDVEEIHFRPDLVVADAAAARAAAHAQAGELAKRFA